MSNLVTYPMLKEQVARLESNIEWMKKNNQRVVDVLSGVLYNVVDDGSIDADDVFHAINRLHEYASYDKDIIVGILEDNEALPEGMLRREYQVHMTVPVMLTINISARNADEAEEMAIDELDCNGLCDYHLDYNSYDIECEVYEA